MIMFSCSTTCNTLNLWTILISFLCCLRFNGLLSSRQIIITIEGCLYLSAEKDKYQTLINWRKILDSSNHPRSLCQADRLRVRHLSRAQILESYMVVPRHRFTGATGSIRARLADERTLHGRTIMCYTSEVLGETSLAKILAVRRKRHGGAATTTEASCTIHCDGRGERGRGIRG